ncbi:hypothetical protein [Allopontixanthobacter sp.]|uniref:hypothetical protein n=1 Tax=Allopontixanthobacter sp. TaxID=2906452 RepID=UPI002ABB1AF9|nr:hypothetical protein [Allopontixanthobacter sp.]MDZ4306448.1 hypothetical protein [Allopontixanthobacter sp.]
MLVMDGSLSSPDARAVARQPRLPPPGSRGNPAGALSLREAPLQPAFDQRIFALRSHEGNRPDAPYFRHLIGEAAETGLPLQRPLLLHYPDQVEFAECQDQYSLGTDLVIASCHPP